MRGVSNFLGTEEQGSNHKIGCSLPHTSLSKAILALFGLKGPCCLTCSTAVSSVRIAWSWSINIAATNIPNNALSRRSITQCILEKRSVRLFIINCFILTFWPVSLEYLLHSLHTLSSMILLPRLSHRLIALLQHDCRCVLCVSFILFTYRHILKTV